MAHQFYFSPHILDHLPVPAAGFDVVQDTAEPRLRMYITSRGVKSFFVRKRINGRDRRVIIGTYPKMEIPDARAAVDSALKAVIVKPAVRRKKTGFQKIADLYLLKKVRRSEANRDKLIRQMKQHISPLFPKNVQDITAGDVADTLSKIGGAAIRNRMHELLDSIFKFSVLGGYITENPIAVVKKVKEQRRSRPLDAAALNRLVAAANRLPDQNIRSAFLMLVYGFAPKSKVFSMRWKDLDFNNYTWAGQPLSDLAVVLLEQLPQDGKWVFPGRGGRHITDPRMAWKRLAASARVPSAQMDDVHKFIMRRLQWANAREDLRCNMNDTLSSVLL
ncbi:MAG: integrase family protein [Rickettsiales bacterium]|jgi:integrase|nr:integrase family protein [Rickettsiales bacterium]